MIAIEPMTVEHVMPHYRKHSASLKIVGMFKGKLNAFSKLYDRMTYRHYID